MGRIDLTVKQRGGMWCVEVDDRRKIIHLGNSHDRQSAVAYMERLASQIVAGGNRPIVHQPTRRPPATIKPDASYQSGYPD